VLRISDFLLGNEQRGVVLNLGNLDFDIVSNFVLRISDFGGSSRRSTLVERTLQITPFYAKQTQS
jgi:hypothetical protein